MKKPLVAIVDDDSAFASYLRTFLSLRGYETRAYSRGDEMLAAIRQGDPPDIVLLDVMMPGLDGSEVADRLHAVPRFHNLPIIFLTAAVKKQEVASRGGICGGIPFVAKPVEFQEVLHHVETACTPGAAATTTGGVPSGTRGVSGRQE